jgi:hypothetical protein
MHPTLIDKNPLAPRFGAGCVMCLAAPIMEDLLKQSTQAKEGKPVQPGEGANRLRQFLGGHKLTIQHNSRTRLIPASSAVIPTLEVAAMPRLWEPRTQCYQVKPQADNPLFSAVIQGLQAVKALPGAYRKSAVQTYVDLKPLDIKTTGVNTPFRTVVIGHFLKGTGTQVPVPMGYVTDASHPRHGRVLLSVRSLPGMEKLDVEQAAISQWCQWSTQQPQWFALEPWQTDLLPMARQLGRPVPLSDLPAPLQNWLKQHNPGCQVFAC